MAVAVELDLDIAPAAETVAISPAAAHPGAVPQRRGGWLRRMMFSPLMRGGAAPPVDTARPAPDDDAGEGAKKKKARRGGWLRRLLVPPRRWNKLGGEPSRLAAEAGLPRWKRLSSGLSVRGGWVSALLDALAFRVMYVVEAVVLGLALSCFFCCCGCQI